MQVGGFDGVIWRQDKGENIVVTAGNALASYHGHTGRDAKVILVNRDDVVCIGEMPGVEVRVGPVQRGHVYAGVMTHGA